MNFYLIVVVNDGDTLVLPRKKTTTVLTKKKTINYLSEYLQVLFILVYLFLSQLTHISWMMRSQQSINTIKVFPSKKYFLGEIIDKKEKKISL